MRPDPKERYFVMPHEIFQLGLCDSEIAIYSYLKNCVNQDYECWPSYTTIGKAVHLCKNTVKKYVDSLTEKGLIATEPTSRYTEDGFKLNGNLRYTVLPIQEAIRRFYERQLEEVDLAAHRQKVAQRLEKTADEEVD